MSCLDKFHILEIENLSVVFHQYAKRTKKQELPVISNLNVSVHEGEIVAVVGSSGSGKSLLAHAILGLMPSNAEVKGRFDFLEEPLTEERMKAVRGNETWMQELDWYIICTFTRWYNKKHQRRKHMSRVGFVRNSIYEKGLKKMARA